MIIAFGHKSRVGKDTAALMLEEYATKVMPGMTVRRCGFAWQIKAVAAELYQWAGLGDREYYEKNPAKRTEIIPALGMTPVQLWTALGDSLTAVHSGTLIEPVLNWAPANLTPKHSAHGLLIVSDLRREADITAVHAHRGVVVKVVRPDAPANVSTADAYLDHCVDWDYILVNDGSQAQLRTKVEVLFWEVWSRVGGTGVPPSQPTASICPLCYSRDLKHLVSYGTSVCQDCGSAVKTSTNSEILTYNQRQVG